MAQLHIKDPERMIHNQMVMIDRELSSKELQEFGAELAKREKEKKEIAGEKKELLKGFKLRLKECEKGIEELSHCINTGKAAETVECEVTLNRLAGTKNCTRKDTGETFETKMNDEDYSLLTD